MKKLLSILLALAMAFALLPVSALQSAAVLQAPVNPDAVGAKDEDEIEPDPDRIVTFLVKLPGSPIAEKVRELDSEAAARLRSLLKKQQEKTMDGVRAAANGDAVEFPFSYQLLFNGFAVKAPYSMRARLEKLPGVESVTVAPEYAAPEAFEEPGARLSTSVGLINADEAWDMGYTGGGTAIAMIDTGCVLGHEAFSIAPADGRMNIASVTGVLNAEALHAEELYTGLLTAGSLYYSGKIPFRFNYATGTVNVSHAYSGSDHGTHAAGVAAGNGPAEYKGVAKDAQLIIMQVYNSDGTADWATVMAALEDCAYLGVDSVNIAFGNDLGFSCASDDIERVFGLLAARGVNVSASAGDSGSSSGQQYYGSGFSYALAMNPDNGLIAAPASYSGPLAVASCTKESPSVSNTSNAGSASDLKLKPELTAPGVSVIGPVDPNNAGDISNYDSKSGTSTAAAHAAGAQALLTGYVNDTFPALSPAEKAAMVDRLLMCTANPIAGVSPRRQGAGVMDVGKAVTTKAYVTVEGGARPKLELGDDPERSGVYTLSFSVVNFGGSALTFTPQVSVLTPSIGSRKLHGETVNYIKGTCDDITSACTISKPSAISVPANGSASVTVTVSLSAAQKALLDGTCVNGAVIEGFVALQGNVSLSIPFLAYYGDWNEPSVLDRYTYIDQIEGGAPLNVHTRQLQVGSYFNESEFMLLGANPYISTSDWFADRCTISPNGDGNYDRLDRFSAALIRNASLASLSIVNEYDPDAVYYSEQISGIPKSWRYRTGNYSYTWSYASDWFAFRDWAPADLAEGTHVTFSLSFELDSPGFTQEGNECANIVLPVTIDVTPPEVLQWSISGGTLDITVHDAHYAAWIGVYADAACTNLIAQSAITERERGAVTRLSLPIGSRSTVYAVLGDYGRNTSDVLTLTGSGPNEVSWAGITPASLETIPGRTESLTVSYTPDNASVQRVVWTSSDTSIMTVEGNGLSASVTALKRGSVTITAAVTDITGKTVEASADISVRNGYEFDHFEPTDSIEPGTEYLIGFDTDSGVYLLMNSDPDPIGPSIYYYNDGEADHCYGVKAVLDGEGNVTGVDDSVYPDAALENAEWYFVPVTGYYQIRSAADHSYYLKVNSNMYNSGLRPEYGTGNSTKWSWDAQASHLSYATVVNVKTVAYKASAGVYQNFFCAPPQTDENSAITLYKHTSGIVFLEDPEVSLLGDVDCSDDVTMGDVSLLAAYLLNSGIVTPQGYVNADANEDGAVDVLDLSAVCGIVLGS